MMRKESRGRGPGSTRFGGFIKLTLMAFCLLAASPVRAQFKPPENAMPQSDKPPVLRDVGIDQRLNEQLPLDLSFRDETGAAVRLRQYFGSKPVVIALVYYTCPMLCNQVLNGLVGSLKTISLDAGRDFTVVAVSFDPREDAQTAAAKKHAYLERYGREGASEGWHFLTGDEAPIKALTEAMGFHYKYDTQTDQYIHASGIMVATPEGKLSRYLYGIEYAPRDLRLSLVEASSNKIGTPVDQLMLYCFHYDPVTGTYGPIVMNLIRAGGFVTFIGLGLIIYVMRRRAARRERLRIGEKEGELNPLHFALIPFAPEQASTVAGTVDALYIFLWALTIFFGVLITGLIIYFALKYRRRSEDEYPRPIEGSMKLETVWIVVPFLIVMVIFVWGARVYFAVLRPPEEALEIYVIGKQWMWKFQHPDGHREINTLHIPMGRRVKLIMGTEDVIHSLFVPAFRVKMDVVPGKLTNIWFQPTKPGTYHLFCAEYCGTGHSAMIGSVMVLTPTDYEAWLTGGEAEGSLSSRGQKVFQDLACNSCHRSDGAGRGPMLDDLFGRQVALDNGQNLIADENYLRESILNPKAKIVAGYQPIMPTFQGLVSEEQLLQLIAYIKSLREGGAGGAGAPGPGAVGAPTETRSPGLSSEGNPGGKASGSPQAPVQRENQRQ